MLHPDHEALLHSALDGTLTPAERDALRQLLAESAAARERAGQLGHLNALLASLDPVEAPPSLVTEVLARVSPRSAAARPITAFVPRAIPRRGEIVNKTLIFGLAAAAVVILAVITYTSYPPATEGTEATIGAAQRAQTPQIGPADVKLADQSVQALLQTETWDAIMKDEDLRSTLEDVEMRRRLQDPELRKALEDADVRRALTDPEARKKFSEQEARRKMNEVEARKKLSDVEARKKLNDVEARRKLNEVEARTRAFVDALNDQHFSEALARGAGRALAGEAMAQALRDPNFEAAPKHPRFSEALARKK